MIRRPAVHLPDFGLFDWPYSGSGGGAGGGGVKTPPSQLWGFLDPFG